MSDKTEPNSSFKLTPPRIGEDKYAAFRGIDAFAIYNAQTDGFVLNAELNFEDMLLIYAETVYIQSSTIKLPGKKIGIFCHSLVIGPESACIDVSGANGNAATSSTARAGNGGDGGSVWLYVEAPTPALRTKLSLQAYGGDGGRGADGSPAGNGGDGGASGTISCYIGSAVVRYQERLSTAVVDKNWSVWVKDLSESIAHDMTDLDGTIIDKSTKDAWKTTVLTMVDFLPEVEKLKSALYALVNSTKRVTPKLVVKDKITLLNQSIDKFGSTRIGPGLPKTKDKGALVQLAKDCDDFFGGSAAEQMLLAGMDAVLAIMAELTPTDGRGSPLINNFTAISNDLNASLMLETYEFTSATCQLGGGKGGRGGNGTTPADMAGKPGVNGKESTAETKIVSLVGRQTDCEIDQAIVSPEQCQMILDEADGFYFTNNVLSMPEAMSRYVKLKKRLLFLDVLPKDDAATKTPLGKALSRLDSQYKLSYEVISQLRTIYDTVKRRLACILLKQDMWGHSDTWVPRLSLAYYGDRVTKMIEGFQELEKTFVAYGEAEQKETFTQVEVTAAKKANDAMGRAAKDKMESIMDEGGERDLATIQIHNSGVSMADAGTVLAEALKEFAAEIRSCFSVSADTLLDALSTLSLAPEGFAAVVQAAGVWYKSSSKIEDAQGNLVKKEYIISQIKSCGGSIDSLAREYEKLEPENLKVDDPGYAKIITNAADLEKIVKNFEERISSAEHVKTALTAFLKAATERNAAVITYNALIQTYFRLDGIVKSSKDESQKLGEQLLFLDKSLPAIYFWLKRLKQQNHFEILGELNNQARALCFWAPKVVGSVIFDAPSVKQGTEELLKQQEKLISEFERAYETIRSGAWQSWPGDPTFQKEGISVPLSPRILKDLRNGGDNHEVLLSITPEAHFEFGNMANVRLTQVRVWLRGATVSPVGSGSRTQWPLHVELTHWGYETIHDSNGKACQFQHATVNLHFKYETTLFNPEGLIDQPNIVYEHQDLDYDYGGGAQPGANIKPPFGPFGDWTIRVPKAMNPGLYLDNVTEGWIEFCGRNQALSRPH
ncbi:hypothetical protein F5X68DRAFT_230280 [Plectosphaerella plurivora]|uniref:Serine protein kinase n=1 Tax=Plectosphaerella plurivora TaxID=936078 RepID=A0A9P8VFT8_9PEZI|nr:hypothetical protein F5X68DRAFT_230280 [Plectosphaerella plurivora]